MQSDPVVTATNGRTATGQFGSGNRFASGHRHQTHVATLRRAFTDALRPDDILQLVAKLMELALEGDVTAIRLILDRALGRVQSPDSSADIDDALDVENSIQSVLRQLAGRYPDCSPEALRRKAENHIKFSSLPDDQQSVIVAKMNARKADQAGTNSATILSE